MQAVSALSLAGDALGRQRQMRAGDGNYKVTEANHQRLDKARSQNRVAADRAAPRGAVGACGCFGIFHTRLSVLCTKEASPAAQPSHFRVARGFAGSVGFTW